MAQNRTTPVNSSWPCYQEDYSFEMSGAHRKPAYEIGAPSITWNLGFWNPHSQTESENDPPLYCQPQGLVIESKHLQHRMHWVQQIERQILHVYCRLLDHWSDNRKRWNKPHLTNLQPVRNPVPDELRLLANCYRVTYNEDKWTYVSDSTLDPGDEGNPFKKRYETVHIDGVWNSLPLDIRFEVFGEYFTLTTTIDFSRMINQPANRSFDRRRRRRKGEFNRTYQAYSAASRALHKLIEEANKRRAELLAGHDPGVKDRQIADSKEPARFLFFDIWEQLRTALFQDQHPGRRIYSLGDCFADFRNLSLQCDPKGEAILSPWKEHGSETGHLNPTQRPGTTLRNSILAHSFRDDDIEWVDSTIAVLLAVEDDAVNVQPDADGQKSELAADPVEYTFTKFCNERCIYGSGFGPQIEHRDVRDRIGEGDPLTYLLLFGFDEPRQMGRLVQRINTLGTLRLAALHDLQDTRQRIDDKLNDIEGKLFDLQGLVGEKFEETYGTKRASGANLPKRGVPRKMPPERNVRVDNQADGGDLDQRIGGLLSQIHRDLDHLDAPGESMMIQMHWGWVPFRAYRSEYYLKIFKILASALNSSPIEGYQPYTVFIRHRLSRAYSAFQVTAHLYSTLREKEVRLRREWIALKSELHQSEIQKIQVVGEILFYLVLFPYYMSHTIELAVQRFELKWLPPWVIVAGMVSAGLLILGVARTHIVKKFWNYLLRRE